MMSKPLDKLKKLKGKSLQEIQTRGGQAVAAYSEQLGLRKGLLNDKDMLNVVKSDAFAPSIGVSAAALFEKFYAGSTTGFFPSFLDSDETIQCFRDTFGSEAEEYFIRKADKVVAGKYDLMGFDNLDFGIPPDWHYEPVSETYSPLKHWKQFDESNTRETGDKKIVWELNRHRHFFAIGVAYRLTGDEEYADCFVEQLTDWMEKNPPGIGVNWLSSLEIALRAISWIWSFHLFRGSSAVTPELFYEAFKYLFAHGRHIEQYLSTYYSPNTHLTGEALGLYYLGTQLSFVERADHWKALGEEILLSEIDRQIRPDGVYFEQSTWYQRYTTDFYLQFLVLQKLNGDKLSSKNHKKLVGALRSLLDSQMYFTRPDGSSPLIGDDDGGRVLPDSSDAPDDFRSTLATGAVVFERGDYKWVAGEPKQDLLWLFGPKGISVFNSIQSVKPKHRSRAFTDSGFFVMRDGWLEHDNYMLIDAGEIGSLNGAHGHADTLAIDLAVAGRSMLVDSGTYTYSKTEELRNYFRSSVAHNTLTVDEKSSSDFGDAFSWRSRAEAKVSKWISQDRFDYFEGSHDGYRHLEGSPVDYSRDILFLKSDYWIIRDFVKTVGEHRYQLNFHFNPGTKPAVEGIRDELKCVSENPNGDSGMRMFTFGDNGAWQRKESWVSKNYGSRVNAPFLRYVSKGIGPQEFMTFLLPTFPGNQKPEVFETEIVGGRAFVVNFRGHNDLLVFSDGEQIIRTEFFNTDFKFLWARMRENEKLPDEFVLIGGRNFSVGGREIFNYPKPLEFATARRFGNRLNVRSPESVFSVSLPKTNSRTFILKTTPER